MPEYVEYCPSTVSHFAANATGEVVPSKNHIIMIPTTAVPQVTYRKLLTAFAPMIARTAKQSVIAIERANPPIGAPSQVPSATVPCELYRKPQVCTDVEIAEAKAAVPPTYAVAKTENM